MSLANELIGRLSDDEIAVYLVDPTKEPHIVISSDRVITVPESLRRIAVQFDHDVETVTFDCPRYWDGVDMSSMRVYINYRRSDGYEDKYIAKNVRISSEDDQIMNFDWTISRNVTLVAGGISFNVCIKRQDDEDELETVHWNTEINEQTTVSPGMECSESPVKNNPDIIDQLLTRMNNVEGRVDDAHDRMDELLDAEEVAF